MENDMRFNLQGNVEVDGVQSVKKLDTELNNSLETMKKLETEAGKLGSVLDKLSQIYSKFSQKSNNVSDISAKDRYYQERSRERRRTWEDVQMVSKQTGMYRGDGFVMDSRYSGNAGARMSRSKQPLLLTQDAGKGRPIDWMIQRDNSAADLSEAENIKKAYENASKFFTVYEKKVEEIKKAEEEYKKKMEAMHSKISDDIYDNLYGEGDTTKLSKLSWKEKRDVKKFTNKYQGEITERRLSNSIDAFDTGVAEKQMSQEREWRQQVIGAYEERFRILKLQNQLLLTESAGIKDFKTDIGPKDWMSQASDNRRYYENIKSNFSAERWMNKEREKTSNAPTSSGLLITADAGYSKMAEEKLESLLEDQLAAEEEIAKAKEKEAEAAQEAVDTQEKINKQKGMTQYQQERIRLKDEANAIKRENAETKRREQEERERKNSELSGWNKFKSAHPERFASRGQDWDKPYQAARVLSTLGNKLSSLGTGGRVLGDIIDTVGSFIKSPIAGTATAVIKLGTAVVDLGKAAVQAFSDIEAIKTQLGVVFSNQTQADSMFSQISQYAVKSPFGVQQTSELAVLLKQSGVYASDLMNTLKMLGDTAGGNMEKMKRIANNYAQIVSIGKASMLDMRQFAYAGIPIFEAVSKELKVSQTELRKLISDGKVTSDIVEKVFKDLTGVNGIFEKATEKGAKTLKARLQNLKDAKQLALASIGDNFVNYGSFKGGDSYVNKIVSGVESIYQYLRDDVNTKNLERDVNTIANRDAEIETLKSLIEYNKTIGNDVTNLEKMLAQKLGAIDVDKDRQTFAALYDAYTQNGAFKRSDFYTTVEKLEEEENQLREERIANNQNYWMKKSQEDWGTGIYRWQNLVMPGQAMKMWAQEGNAVIARNATKGSEEALLNESIDMRLAYIADMVEIIKNDSKMMSKLLTANAERNVLNAQQLSFDQTNRASDSATSLNSKFQELANIYKESDVYKEKQEAERKKTLKEALDELKKIEKNTDDKGKVDITKFSRQDLLNYIEQGAFVSSRKLNVVPTNGKYSEADRNLLTQQYGYVSEMIGKELYKLGATDWKFAGAYEQFTKNSIKGITGLGDKEFYQAFSGKNGVYEENIEMLDNIIESTTGETKLLFQGLKTLLNFATNEQEANTMGSGATMDMLDKNKNQFIPLWKRILSSATGLTTNGMTDTLSTMQNYRDDMATRKMTASVLSATMKTMGIDSAMRLMRTNSAQQLTGDDGKTFQMDWISTRKALKDFATQLSASTEVVSAYKQGLEEELEVYQQLIAAGYTEAESTDLGSQKFVSTKQLQKLALGNSSQLVNAFGEVIETASGKKYKTSEVEFRNGEMFDKFGNKINEEIVVTGNLFEFIKQELPRIYNELHEANAAQLNNQALEKIVNQIIPTEYLSRVLKSGSNVDALKFLSNNQDYITSYADSAITMFKNSDSFKGRYGNLSNQDIISRVLNAGNRYNSLLDVKSLAESQGLSLYDIMPNFDDELNSVLEDIHFGDLIFGGLDQNVRKLVNSNDYQNADEMLKFQKQQNELNAAMLKVIGAYSNDNVPFYMQKIPENYGGARGNRNWLFRALGWNTDAFDNEDLLLKAAKSGYFKNDERFQTANKSDFFEGLTDSSILSFLDDADKRAVSLAYHFESIAKSIDDMKVGLVQAMDAFAQGSFLAPFEQAGEWLVKDNEYTKGLQERMKQLGAEMLSQMGTYMARAGFSLVAMGAETANYGLVAGGLALAAAGGFASGLGGALKEGEQSENNKKEIQKLENLKSDLQKLLEQARTDALYYENNLRHKTAVGINKDFSYKSVHDAIITPKGVVETDPKDYLIATKTPQNFVGGGNVTVTPVINCNVVNNTNSRVRQEQVQNADGSIDILTIIDEAVGDYIASPRSDDAFSAREYRIKGRQAIM